MSSASPEKRQEILALEPRLLDWAGRMTRDANEAQALVRETLAAARASALAADDEVAVEVWVFRLLRQQFHSLERDRHHRRATAAFTTDQTYVRKRSQLALAAQADARDAGV
jgi:DNA-directed RNA polymerase specialized sigma24 family protein